ncbi:MAG: GAF domain-containing protein [Burkholderiales bacterium]
MVPLTAAQRRLGALVFASLQEAAYDEVDLQFLQQVAKQVAVAVDNALNYQGVRRYQQELSRERDHLRLLLEVNNAVVSNLDLKPLFRAITTSLRKVIQHEYTLALYDADRNRLRLHALDFPDGKGLIYEGIEAPVDDSPGGLAFATREPALVNARDLEGFHSEFVQQLRAEGVRSVCSLPLIAPSRILGTLNLAGLRDGNFTQEDAELLSQVASQIAIALENALAFREIDELKDKLAKEKLYLEDENTILRR